MFLCGFDIGDTDLAVRGRECACALGGGGGLHFWKELVWDSIIVQVLGGPLV